MAKEDQPGKSQALALPVADFDLFCKQLLEEGLGYDQLPQEIVEKVGTHTSILLHDYPQRDGRWVSIHYREGLESLAGIETSLGRGKAFLTNLANDLHLLSERLEGDLRDVDMIYGLSQVSASWGGNHGFSTEKFTDDPEIIRRHIQSITGLPPQTNDQAPLTLFVIGREVFLRHFHRVPKVQVTDLVGN
ncbi:hypothetical protein M1146_02455 [Patescibacteria group bacterium]|nr:hypothetical protein [Patescibacteria group bacterium]